jgi:hypothetical protein
MKKMIIFLAGIGLFAGVFAHSTALAQEELILHYKTTANILENPFGPGYMAGTNGYNDTGKYQRFDFDEEVLITGAGLYFGVLDPGDGAFGDITVVVRKVGDGGEPGELLRDQVVGLGTMSTGEDGNYITLDHPVDLAEAGVTSIFIGIEWEESLDNEIALLSDKDGEGDNANRVWERFDTGEYNDFLVTRNPDFSWGIDIDLWISAVYSAIPTSIESKEEDVTQHFHLRQNYPNPFNPSTLIEYQLPQTTEIRLEVFNLLGQQIALLHEGVQQAGSHQVHFDAAGLAGGVYIYRLVTPETTTYRAMTLVK